jgi:methylenetetrahydrofolate dehydrogenase (NADP+) / methenyltetrahydrofolate cyclohydrolase
MVKILDGRIVRDTLAIKLKRVITNGKLKPVLAIIQVGEREESSAYIKQKKLFAAGIGAEVKHLQFPVKVSEPRLLNMIEKLNRDERVNGIIVQLPIPKHLDESRLTSAVAKEKDVDGLVPGSPFTPATARGVLNLLDFYKIKIRSKRVTVVGRSRLVGAPIARALLSRDATVTVAHSQTKDLAEVTRSAEILVVAIGDPHFIGKKFLKKDQVVVDVGINVKKLGLKEEVMFGKKTRLVGDVNFKEASKIVSAISPVPGGVGPLTVAALFQNLVEACKNQTGK